MDPRLRGDDGFRYANKSNDGARLRMHARCKNLQLVESTVQKTMKLHNHFRSSASYRVRIALHLKGLHYEYVSVGLTQGEQLLDGFRELNPQRLLPVLQHEERVLTQSLAIIEYLDEAFPSPPLLPPVLWERARVRSLALAAACDIHPLHGQRVLKYLSAELGVPAEARNAWTRHWITEGLQALEERLTMETETGRFCHGDTPTLADICLVPQLQSARRLQCELSRFPRLLAIEENCMALDAFQRAAPTQQPDRDRD
jgi:maleylacetoacetate isomerase